MTDAEFVELCTKLRVLGATVVRVTPQSPHGGLTFEAKFDPAVKVKPPPPPVDPNAPTERPLSHEQAREKAYAEELGREYKPPV